MEIRDIFDKKFIIQISISVGVLALLGTITVFLGIDLNGRAVHIQEKKSELTTQAENIKSLLSLRSDADIAQMYANALAHLLPTKDELLSFGIDMSALARTNHVEVSSSFGAETERVKEALGTVAFTMVVKGGYANIVDFLKSVEEGRYPIMWRGVDIALDGKVSYRVTMNGTVFIQ